MAFSFRQHNRTFRLHARSMAIAVFLVASGSNLQAQSLVEFTEQAQSYDAAWQSARAQLDATISQGAQAKAGLLPQVGIQAGTQYSDTRLLRK